MATLRIHGGRLVADERSPPLARETDSPVKVRRLYSVHFEATRAVAEPVQLDNVADDAVLKVELEDGLCLWTRADDFRNDFPGAARRDVVGSGADAGWELYPTLAAASPARGLGSLAIKALEVFGIDLMGKIARGIARAIETIFVPKPGLYARDLSDGEPRIRKPKASGRDAMLVFVHGTFLNCDRSFADIWTPTDDTRAEVERLQREYATACIFEHRTLTQSPVENAIQLAEALPDKAKVHLVTHSRGGLIGELLCRGQRTDAAEPFREEELEEAGAGEELRKQLLWLGDVLIRKQLQIDRFVRVACPAEGTTLASGRLDRWLSVFVSALLTLLGQKVAPWCQSLSDAVMGLIKERTKPETLPGLEAMMPETPLAKVLNQPAVRVNSDLTVVAGDAEGKGVWGKLALLLPDLFYDGDHDFVVNTGSMYGGAARPDHGARFILDAGPHVSHGRYFRNAGTLKKVVEGLLLKGDDLSAAFQPLEEAVRQAPARGVAGGKGRRAAAPRAPARKGPKLRVSVKHGHLRYALHPVAVGHYQGDTLVGAEAEMDRALGGRLRCRHESRLYPGRLKSFLTCFNPNSLGHPTGALVVGLGKVGELGPGTLEVSFAKAAVDYALLAAEANESVPSPTPRASGPFTVGVSSLLIGTGAGSLSVRDSVEAIVRGVQKANEVLRNARLDQRVVIGAVEFVELYEDLAIDAAQCLRDLGELPDLGGQLEIQPHLQSGTGARRRVRFEEAPGWWHRLEIRSDQKAGTLRFVALTQRARAESRPVAVQQSVVEAFVQAAITTTENRPATAGTLFELLTPNALKEQAPRNDRLVLVLDEDAARYPWELLEDRWKGGAERDNASAAPPLSVRAGLLRQLETKEFRESPFITSDETALVIGDPLSEFTELPGAQEEAQVVEQALKEKGFDVTALVRKEGREILEGLHARAYRLLHLAGHGVHEWDPGPPAAESSPPWPGAGPTVAREKKSGMVLGNNMFLTPLEVEQMRGVPELVFINCCHLGRTDKSPDARFAKKRHLFAANIAAHFIRLGVKAVVAAGWAVDDGAASTFARTFYAAMLDGRTFGDAVQAARRETLQKHPAVNTWGAYQCYGDPGYRLRSSRDNDGAPATSTWRFTCPAELIVELTNLASEAQTATDAALPALRQRLEALQSGAAPEWLARADVASARGLAYGELQNFARAIQCLDVALQAENADTPVRVIEQRANFRCRWAVELTRASAKSSADNESPPLAPADMIKKAVSEVEQLLGLGRTSERLSLLGGAYKRLARITAGNERRAALDHMAAWYAEAAKMAPDNPYPRLNEVTARALAAALRGPLPQELRQRIGTVAADAQAAFVKTDQQDPNFWNSVIPGDCAVLRAIALGGTPRDKAKRTEEMDAARKAYRAARERGGSPREYRSVLEHVEFVADVLAEPRRGRGAAAAVQKALAGLLEELRT